MPIVGEFWRDVAGYKGKYRVSNLGRVKSLPRKTWNGHVWYLLKGRILSPGFAAGRPYVQLFEDNRGQNFFVHTLVLTAFIGPCPEGMECCHFPDPSVVNNRLENLRWDTCRNNARDKIIHGTSGKGKPKPYNQGVLHPFCRMDDERVRRLRDLRGQGWSFNRLGREFGIAKRTAMSICQRKTWKHVL